MEDWVPKEGGQWTFHRDKKMKFEPSLGGDQGALTFSIIYFWGYLYSEWICFVRRNDKGGLFCIQMLSWCSSPHRLQHVCHGHWDLAFWILEHDEVESRTQVGYHGQKCASEGGHMPMDLVYIGASCQPPPPGLGDPASPFLDFTLND